MTSCFNLYTMPNYESPFGQQNKSPFVESPILN